MKRMEDDRLLGLAIWLLACIALLAAAVDSHGQTTQRIVGAAVAAGGVALAMKSADCGPARDFTVAPIVRGGQGVFDVRGLPPEPGDYPLADGFIRLAPKPDWFGACHAKGFGDVPAYGVNKGRVAAGVGLAVLGVAIGTVWADGPEVAFDGGGVAVRKSFGW